MWKRLGEILILLLFASVTTFLWIVTLKPEVLGKDKDKGEFEFEFKKVEGSRYLVERFKVFDGQEWVEVDAEFEKGRKNLVFWNKVFEVSKLGVSCRAFYRVAGLLVLDVYDTLQAHDEVWCEKFYRVVVKNAKQLFPDCAGVKILVNGTSVESINSFLDTSRVWKL